MDEMEKRRNGRERLFNLFYDIKDLLSDLIMVKEERNNDGLELFQTDFKKLKKSVKRMFAEFEEQLPMVKIDKEELELIKKLKAEVQEALA